MKFKAYIKYNFLQSREAKLMGDKNITGTESEFIFGDIVGKYLQISENSIFMPPLFTARELIIPWLQAGNIPELIISESE